MDLFAHRMDEYEEKLVRLRHWMINKNVSCLLITEAHNFSWLTCGGENFVYFASTKGSANLLVTPDEVYLVCSNIETARMYEEELGGLPIRNGEHPWQLNHDEWQAHFNKLGEGEIYVDTPLEGDLRRLRDPLFPDEIERYRWLGQRAEEAIRSAALSIRPGMSEYEAVGLLSRECLSRSIWPGLLLMASDQRAEKYRHPLPSDKKIERYFMLVLCARRYGLVASVTRMLSFGPTTDVLKRKHDAVCRVDAALNLSCKPGVHYANVLQRGIEEYERNGYGDEWRLHHQGGVTGYLSRTHKVIPDSTDVVLVNQAVAWNPSITGTKSEDTALVREHGIEILTQAKEWPMLEVEVDGKTLQRCDILVA